jgi:two-component system, NarL family, response regulator LiaR
LPWPGRPVRAKSGGSLLHPVVASRLLERLAVTEHPEELTPRERAVLALLDRGQQNKEIAADLGISECIVKFHLSSICGKLGAGNRTEAVRIAVRQGLLEL